MLEKGPLRRVEVPQESLDLGFGDGGRPTNLTTDFTANLSKQQRRRAGVGAPQQFLEHLKFKGAVSAQLRCCERVTRRSLHKINRELPAWQGNDDCSRDQVARPHAIAI